MNNKNTYKLNDFFDTKSNYLELVPQVGDELVFCDDEEVAVRSYMAFVGSEFNIEITGEFLTDFFELKEVKGTMCKLIYIGEKRYGFLGCRYMSAEEHMPKMQEGRFFLYEMD